MNKIRAFLGFRMRALILKEFRQILRDRRLAMSLILPPTLQLLLFGFALNATVSNLRMGVVDDSRTPESRELVATMTESKSFEGAGTYFDVNELSKKIANGNLDDAGLSPADRALLDYVTKVTEAAYRTTHDDVQRLRDVGWTEPQIAEAVYVTAMFAYFNRVADAFGIASQGYLEMNGLTK